MPNIKISGLETAKVRELSKKLTADLAKAIDCPADWLTFSVGGDVFCCGEPATDTVFVHVEWFDRGGTTKDVVAKLINAAILGGEISTVDIIFVDLKKSDYFENGEHF